MNTSTPKPPRQHDVDEQKQAEAQGSKATQFDGNPNPEGSASDVFKPKDDTPFVLKKREGAKTPDTAPKKSRPQDES